MLSVSVKLKNKKDSNEKSLTFDVDNIFIKNDADTVLNFRNNMTFMELFRITSAYELEIYVAHDGFCQLTVPTKSIYWVRYFDN